MAFVIGEAVDGLRTRSALGQEFDDHIMMLNIPRFRPDFMDEPDIATWLDYVGPLPWLIDDRRLTWTSTSQRTTQREKSS
jgi:hypothetical protein